MHLASICVQLLPLHLNRALDNPIVHLVRRVARSGLDVLGPTGEGDLPTRVLRAAAAYREAPPSRQPEDRLTQ